MQITHFKNRPAGPNPSGSDWSNRLALFVLPEAPISRVRFFNVRQYPQLRFQVIDEQPVTRLNTERLMRHIAVIGAGITATTAIFAAARIPRQHYRLASLSGDGDIICEWRTTRPATWVEPLVNGA
jgi:hypothetical protein